MIFFLGGGGREMLICINFLKCEWLNIEQCFNILSTECRFFSQKYRHFIYKTLEEGNLTTHQFMFVYWNTIKPRHWKTGDRLFASPERPPVT